MTRSAAHALSLLTRKKRFGDPWIGHPLLNQGIALHRRRMQLAEGLCRWRRWLVAPQGVAPGAWPLPAAALAALARDGCVQIPDFLPAAMPETARVCVDPWLTACSRAVIGLPHRPANKEVYLTVHGEEARTPDLQKVLHRDTFFRALKFWLFLRPVEPEDGPFEYVPGSHRLDRRRLQWEQATANAAIATRAMPNLGGSFRIQEAELGALGLPRPVSFSCPANTLVLADVLGFHRRGDALPGRQRLALYGWLRPYPFSPLPW